MADPEGTSSPWYKNLSDGVAGLAGPLISITGDIIDIDTGGRLGGQLLGPAGDAVDVYLKATDEDGFTGQDAASTVGGGAAGYLSGVVVAALSSNPATIGIAVLIGGAIGGFTIDHMKFGGTGPLHEEKYWEHAIQLIENSNIHPATKYNILRELKLALGVPALRQEIGEKYGIVDPRCFPATTPIAISPTKTRPISQIRVGDTVLAFDPAADLGRGALVPRKVVRLYRNTTKEWVKLTWTEGGEAKELIATPGHHFLDRFGSFPTIEDMLENGKATVVLASGELTTGEVGNERGAAA